MTLLLLLLASFSAAVDVNAPPSQVLTDAEQVAILKPEKEAADLNAQIQQINARFTQIQAEAQQLQAQFPLLQAREQDANRRVDAAIDDAYKAHKLDKAKVGFDKDKLIFTTTK